MNDFLVSVGALCVLAGCYWIMPALALVVLGLMLIGIGMARTAEPSRTPVVLNLDTTSPPKYLAMVINPKVSAITNIGVAPLPCKVIGTQLFGPNSDMAVKHIQSSINRNNGDSIELRFPDKVASSADFGAGHFCPKKRYA